MLKLISLYNVVDKTLALLYVIGVKLLLSNNSLINFAEVRKRFDSEVLCQYPLT